MAEEDLIYVAFADQLQRAHTGELSLLDEDDGLVVRWAEICNERLQNLLSEFNPEEVDAWTLERNTWQLVQALYAERLAEPIRSESPSPLGASASTSKNPYTPPITVVQKLIESNKDLVELSAIRDWLHSIPTSLNPAEIRRGYLHYTLLKLKQAKRSGAALPRGLVDELDPDAILRGKDGARIDPDDASYERALLRSLFEYVRAGELDMAIDMCRQSDQAWRAASLSGGKLWWDPLIAPGEEGYGEDDMDDGVIGSERRAKGNLNRKLWKTMCRKLASAPGLDPYERALYGAISGDTASVLPVCTSWEDHVWVHVNALLEASIEASLWGSSEGRFWTRGAVKSTDASDKKQDVEDILLGPVGQGASVRGELVAIFDRMLRLESGELAVAAKNPFHVSQTYLIIGRINDLFTTFVDRLEQSAMETEPETLAHLLRFFAHLVLVLRLLKQPLPEYAANRILEAYVQVLEANDQNDDLIAFYASNLDSSSAIESYARFLLTFGPESDRASRQAALLKTHEHGLDLAKIACRTVELVLAEVREDLAVADSPSFDAYARVDPRQLELIRSLEWLTFDRSTYPDALTQANALIRYFLTSDKPHAARELLFRLPSDLISAAVTTADREEQGSQVREYLDYSAFFDCLEKHSRWAEIWARKPRTNASKLDQVQFSDGVATLVDEFYASTKTLLESDWLKLELFGQNEYEARRRSDELALIRQLLIPHLIFRLHHTLYDTHHNIPSNLKRTLDLANMVADEKYKLYLEFVTLQGNKMPEYLLLVRSANIAAFN